MIPEAPITERLRQDAEAWATTARNTVAGTSTSRLEREAADTIDELVAAIKQATLRADDDLKKHFRSRTDACAKDYARCVAAVSKATGESL